MLNDYLNEQIAFYRTKSNKSLKEAQNFAVDQDLILSDLDQSSTNIAKKTRIFGKKLTSQGTVQESSPSWRDAPCKSMNIIFFMH